MPVLRALRIHKYMYMYIQCRHLVKEVNVPQHSTRAGELENWGRPNVVSLLLAVGATEHPTPQIKGT